MIGICTRYQRHEATYAALRLAEWYESRGEDVSVFGIQSGFHPVSHKWDRRVVVGDLFSEWAYPCRTIIWTTIPHPEQLVWVKQLGIRTVALVFWHELVHSDRQTLSMFDQLLCPRAACYSFLSAWGLKNIYSIGWDCGYPIFRKPDDYKIEGLNVLLPLWDGNARKTEMTILDVIDRCLVRESTCRFTVAYSSSTLKPTAQKRLDRMRRVYPDRLTLQKAIHPDDRPLLYSAHDLTLWPTHHENTCMTAHASYEMGTPVMGFTFPPTNEVLDEQISIPVPCCGVNRNDLGLPQVIPNYDMLDEFLLHAAQDVDYVRQLQRNIAGFTTEPREHFHERLSRTLPTYERTEA
jgi:hypothetical protein